VTTEIEGVRRLAFCPHCGNTAPQELLFHRIITDQLLASRLVKTGTDASGAPVYEKREEFMEVPAGYYLSACPTCDCSLLYYSLGNPPYPEAFEQADLVYPDFHRYAAILPETVFARYKEAIGVLRRNPGLFAVALGKALEAICQDRKVPGKTLNDQLKYLAHQEQLGPLATAIATELRTFRNRGAHHDTKRVLTSHAEALHEAFQALLWYVYVWPARLKDFQDFMKSYRYSLHDQKP
jgi:Domain of unknown function (DUF4145)